MAEKLDAHDLERLADVVATRRADLGWSKEQAAREAGISSITWKRVEDGLPVQDAKLALVFKAIGIHGFGSARGFVGMSRDQSSVELRTFEATRRAREDVMGVEEEMDLTVRLIARLRVELASAENRLNALAQRAADRAELSEPADTTDLALVADPDNDAAGESESYNEP